MIELLPLVSYDYPKDPSQEIDTIKRYRKPFMDTYLIDSESSSQTFFYRGVKESSAVYSDRAEIA
ncbi:hypothetical protein N7490_006805 [Penicillium lividum]|nr:hypothetical protein N7490_006805 [Penicillium lividum]